MTEVRRDGFALHTRRRFVRQHDALGRQFALATRILVKGLAVAFGDRELILVGHVTTAGGVHPAVLVVEALIDEKLPPRDRAVGFQPFFAGHVDFGPEVVVGVRIDQQQRMTVGGVLRRNREAVRPRGLPRLNIRVKLGRALLAQRRGRRHSHARRVELRDATGVHTRNVSADAAFGKGERHPRLELRKQLRLHLRMGGQIVVEPIRKTVHQRFQPRRTFSVLDLHVERVDEQLHAQIAPKRPLALHFRRASHRGDVVRLHAIEIIFGLRVHHAKYGVGVGLAIHVGDAPLIAHDRDAVGLLLPRGGLRRRKRRREQQGCRNDGAEHDAHGRAYRGLQVRITGGTPRWRCRRKSACAAASQS